VARRYFTAVNVCLLTACTIAPLHSASDIAPLIELPIVLRNGLPTVTVVVAGTSLDLFLDLAGHNTISLTAEELARVPVRYLDAADRYRNSSGTTFTARRFVAPHVVAAGYSVGDLEGGEYVLPSTGGPPDRNGYLGHGFLTKYLLVLDYPSRRVRLYRPGDQNAFKAECGAPQFAVTNRGGFTTSFADTEYGPISVLWDTGATHNFLRPSAVPAVVKLARKIDEGEPVISILEVDLGNGNIGPLDFRLLSFAAPDVDATFGTGLFATRKVCFDFVLGKGAIR